MHFIKGLQKTSLVDYPGKVCATIFTARCNFRCGFCHNKDLVLDYEKLPEIREEEILEFLENRKKWIDGATITGGEPCVHGDRLIELIKKIKKLNLLVKLDTNGSFPDLIEKLLKEGWVDYISMDIKAPPEKYNKIAGVKVDLKNIKKSIELIKNSGVDYEFRTTVTPDLNKDDLIEIGKLLQGSKKFAIQQFRIQKNKLINEKLENSQPYADKELDEMKKAVENYFDAVEIRNI